MHRIVGHLVVIAIIAAAIALRFAATGQLLHTSGW